MSQSPPTPPAILPHLLDHPDSSLIPEGNAQYFPDPIDPSVTGGLPINLDSLRDGPPGTKPFYPYSTLIRYAIKGSPHQKLLLEDIYYAIESRFPYFRTAANGWKNSIRHNLSLSPCFEKIARPLTDRGKGSYWIVNDNVDPRTGVHRIRPKKNAASGSGGKKKGKAKDGNSGADDEGNEEEGGYISAEAGGSGVAAAAQFQQQQQGQAGGPPPNDAQSDFHALFPPPPQFDPNFQQPSPQFILENSGPFEVDDNGQIDWKATWIKELSQLQTLTEMHDKANGDPMWYHIMFIRVRAALMGVPPPPPPNGMVHMPPPIEPQQPQPGPSADGPGPAQN